MVFWSIVGVSVVVLLAAAWSMDHRRRNALDAPPAPGAGETAQNDAAKQQGQIHRMYGHGPGEY